MVGLFRFAGNYGRDFITSFATPLPAYILALCGRNRRPAQNRGFGGAGGIAFHSQLFDEIKI